MQPTSTELIVELSRLRNRHVARTLDRITDPDEQTVRAVKTGFSEIRDDFLNLIENTGTAFHERFQH